MYYNFVRIHQTLKVTPIEHIVDGRKEAAREGAAQTLVRRFTRRPMSANVGNALLGLCLGSGLGLRGEREDSRVLPFIEPRQQHDLAIGELERVMIGVKHAFVDLAKDRNGVAGIDTKDEGRLILDRRLEREFGTRKYADSTEQSSGAANPRVPVPKLYVTSFSPTLAGRVRTLCRL